jgi:hypothetical protein
MVFKDREAVMDWMDANQLGRRNISPDAFRLLLGRRYNRMKKVQGGTGANQHKQKAQFEPFASTADKLAVEHSVSRETVKRAGKFAEEVEASPALQDAIKQNKPVRKVKKEVQKEEKKKALEEAIQSITERETRNNDEDHSILKRKKKFSSSDGGNSMQIFPSTTDNESGITVKGV